MDLDLPIWTIRPNWKGGILERLGWLTDVLGSDTGVEQRRALRLSPRRSFEFTVNPTNGERTYLDLLLHRLGGAEWLLPLWHDQATLTVSTAPDDETLSFDNTFREFRVGDYALIYSSAYVWEAVQIIEMTDEGVTLSEPLVKTWPRKTRVFPLRKALLSPETSIKALTSRVGESVVLFTINEANDHPPLAAGDVPYYDGFPLLTIEPNRVSEITTTHTRMLDEQDGSTGLVERVDKAGRAFGLQSHNWQIRGREAQSAFRSFLYTLDGRRRKVWLPTFNDDLLLARATVAGGSRLDVLRTGMTYVGGNLAIPGRDIIWSGKEVAKIALVSGAVGGETDRLGMEAPLEHVYAPGAAWSFLQEARLGQDDIEILHHADSDGAMECNAAFRAFVDERIEEGNNENPDPELPAEPEPEWAWRVWHHVYRISLDDTPHCGGMSTPGEGWVAMEPDHQNWRYGWETKTLHPIGYIITTVSQLMGGCTPAGTVCYNEYPYEAGFCMAALECEYYKNPGEIITLSIWEHVHLYPIDIKGALGVENLTIPRP